MKTGRYKNTYILFFGPLKHIQNSKQSEADTWEPLPVSVPPKLLKLPRILKISLHEFFLKNT